MLKFWQGYCEFAGYLVMAQFCVLFWLALQLRSLDKMRNERTK
jgi:hypothetical protein